MSTMLLMELNYWHEGLSHEKMMECVARRADYSYPAGVTPIAEYWPAGVGSDTPAVVAIYEATDFAPFLGQEMLWSEYFDMRWFPIVSADEGIRFVKEALAEVEQLVG
jgi:hypothetical protein